MKQPAANHRPTHAGYPSDEPLRVGGPGRDFGPPLGVVCAAPGTHAAVAAALGARVQAEFDAGAEHVRIDAIDPADADYVPADMLVTLEPIQRAYLPASAFADAFDLREFGRLDEFRIPAPTGRAQVWLDEMADWPDDAAFAVLASHERQRRNDPVPVAAPQPGESGLPAGFTLEAGDALRAFCNAIAP